MKDPRVAIQSVSIPLALQCKLVSPIKQANFKITLGFINEIPPFETLFSDLIEVIPEYSEHLSNPNVVSFMLTNEIDVTLLIAKNTSKNFLNCLS